MPELPEVETVVRGLAPAVMGRRITAVTVRDGRLRVPVATDLPARLAGRRITDLGRHGKFILAPLDDAAVWLVHLGMTGRLTIGPARDAYAAHDHVVVDLEGGGRLIYNDARRFGRIDVVAAADVARETVPGVDALAPGYTPELIFALSRRRRTSVKALLMDQRQIAGLGNIYVSEILFRAGIRPGRAAGRLSRADCARIVAETGVVLGAAIARGGSSISDFRNQAGDPGSYQDAHAVYDRAGAPCLVCGAPVRMRVIAGRSTFWCACCQR
ncbi:MAG: bifunctional DNA-formamidopyrimidine glycosylase/DNA-(apurinic or apyrimidinic site) lyase [bacterium]|nr:bifunctional DNA-formamidopyrimidine glycosylase/DNA-(apurinic or apyrimidinic site) lyase [bacterium]